ncbi:MAG: periplasmic heavy metal sensor [Desulfuromonadaceae bacterium]|nr:periplasmic heavy metal sensor [Desulfuromonadaceae bacterium]
MKKIEMASHLSFKRFMPAAVALFSLLLVAAAPSISEARGPHGEGPSEERMLGHLQYRLKLTPEQMEKVRPVVQEESAKMMELKAEHHKKMREMRGEFRKEMKARHDRMGERLNDILTPEQKEEYRKMKEEREAWRKERMENGCRGKFKGQGKSGPAANQ